ncbi:MAG TPA: hypothetical protein VF363_08380 [Candidatus Eisenbacteria bacterium]
MRRTTMTMALAGVLGASMILIAPDTALAERGKGWTARPGGRGMEERRLERRSDRTWNRQWRSWRGGRVYRDVIVIRGGERSPRYRAWRYYAYPEFRYRSHVVYVRPVRYFTAVATIGGVRIGARFRDADARRYGCNFCDARFDDYGSYRAHLYDCPRRPPGFRIVAQDWSDQDVNRGSWWDDHDWHDDEGWDN